MESAGPMGLPAARKVLIKFEEVVSKDTKDPKQVMLENYKEKDAILAEWDKQTAAGTFTDKSWMSQFEQIETHRLEGIYDLKGYSEDEIVVRDFLKNNQIDQIFYILNSISPRPLKRLTSTLALARNSDASNSSRCASSRA